MLQITRVTSQTPGAVARLQQVGRRTFADTFADNNDPQELARYLEESFSEAQIQRELEHPDSFFYLLEGEGRDLGYLKLNLLGAFSDQVNLSGALELQRIYLLPAAQGRGAGRLLMAKAREVARQHGCARIWLGVWERNERAIAFYHKLGFAEFGRHTFMFGAEAQTDLLMCLELPEG